MHSISQAICNLPLPGLALTEHAAWPVWSDSTTEEVKFQPMPQRKAVKLWHRARKFDRQTKRKGRHGGAVGHTALQVLHALIFDFLDCRSGRLDPGYAAIARKTNLCVRAVATALQRLKELRILNWLRRCAEIRREDGRFMLNQLTNAYAVLPSSRWRGYREPAEAPPPAPGTWGDHPPLPSVIAQAADDRLRWGGAPRAQIKILESDPSDHLAAALARLGTSVAERNDMAAQMANP